MKILDVIPVNFDIISEDMKKYAGRSSPQL